MKPEEKTGQAQRGKKTAAAAAGTKRRPVKAAPKAAPKAAAKSAATAGKNNLFRLSIQVISIWIHSEIFFKFF